MNLEAPDKCGLCERLCAGNPVVAYGLGLCPALAVTARVADAAVMAAAMLCVSLCASVAFSLLRKVMPRPGRLLIEVMIVAAFVTAFDLLLKAYYWPMSVRLGPYVALIAVNCIILYRAESLAMARGPLRAAAGGLANGLAFAGVLVLLGGVRELLGAGSIGGLAVWPAGWYEPNRLMGQAGGAFLTLGGLVALLNALAGRSGEEGGR